MIVYHLFLSSFHSFHIASYTLCEDNPVNYVTEDLSEEDIQMVSVCKVSLEAKSSSYIVHNILHFVMTFLATLQTEILSFYINVGLLLEHSY